MQISLVEEQNTVFSFFFFKVSSFSSLRYVCDSLLNIQTQNEILLTM